MRGEPRGELLHRADRLGIRIDAEDLVSGPEQIDQVPARPASGVEHPHARDQSFSEELIEQVDVDPAELILKIGHPSDGRRGGLLTMSQQDEGEAEQEHHVGKVENPGAERTNPHIQEVDHPPPEEPVPQVG